jgi:hypothetical protein
MEIAFYHVLQYTCVLFTFHVLCVKLFRCHFLAKAAIHVVILYHFVLNIDFVSTGCGYEVVCLLRRDNLDIALSRSSPPSFVILQLSFEVYEFLIRSYIPQSGTVQRLNVFIFISTSILWIATSVAELQGHLGDVLHLNFMALFIVYRVFILLFDSRKLYKEKRTSPTFFWVLLFQFLFCIRIAILCAIMERLFGSKVATLLHSTYSK